MKAAEKITLIHSNPRRPPHLPVQIYFEYIHATLVSCIFFPVSYGYSILISNLCCYNEISKEDGIYPPVSYKNGGKRSF